MAGESVTLKIKKKNDSMFYCCWTYFFLITHMGFAKNYITDLKQNKQTKQMGDDTPHFLDRIERKQFEEELCSYSIFLSTIQGANIKIWKPQKLYQR